MTSTRTGTTRGTRCRGAETAMPRRATPPRRRADRGAARGAAVRRRAAADAGARSRRSRASTARPSTSGSGDLEVRSRGAASGSSLSGDRVELATAPEAGALIARYVGADAVRLSPASLETLAIVAYRQPVTRAGDRADPRRRLGLHGPRASLHRRLVVEQGRSEAPGPADPVRHGLRVPRAVRARRPSTSCRRSTSTSPPGWPRDGDGRRCDRRRAEPAAAAPDAAPIPPARADRVPPSGLQKVLAAAGVASRRGADELVAAGRVTRRRAAAVARRAGRPGAPS